MLRMVNSIVFALLATTNAYCDVYKWVDPEGTVHYSDQPAPETIKEEQTLGIKSGTSSTVVPGAEKAGPKSTGPKTYIEQDKEFRKRQMEADEKRAKDEKALADAKDRQQNCDRARSSLADLQSGQRIARMNAQGERVYMDDNQRQQEMIAAQKSADSWCNPAK